MPGIVDSGGEPASDSMYTYTSIDEAWHAMITMTMEYTCTNTELPNVFVEHLIFLSSTTGLTRA